MEVPILLTAVKNKVKNSPHLPEKYKVIVYHLLKKVFEEWKKEVIEEHGKEPEIGDYDLPPGFDFLFRDRSKI